MTGVALFFACASAFLSLVFGSTDVAGKTFHAGGSIGTWLGGALADYLNQTGSIIVLLTLMVLSVILSTQFSFGRMFASASEELARSVGARRRLAARAGSTSGARSSARARSSPSTRRRRRRRRRDRTAKPTADGGPTADAMPALRPGRDPRRPVVARKRPGGAAAAAAGARAGQGRRAATQGAFTLPPASLLDAPKANGRSTSAS